MMKTRGLDIPDERSAAFYLSCIGYYRLGGYFEHFQQPQSDQYVTGATFDDVLDLYIFDRELRLLVMDAIERIEVAFRVAMSNAMCMKYGAHWFMESNHFSSVSGFNHRKFLKLIEQETGYGKKDDNPRRTPFLNHYYSKYWWPKLPPSWMIIEVLSIGAWSRAYASLANPQDRLEIARQFSSRPEIFGSWFHSIAFLRNVCAHHLVLWNRTFTIHPSVLEVDGAALRETRKFYAFGALITKVLALISPRTGWAHRLHSLMAKHPNARPECMGFPDKWLSISFWSKAINEGVRPSSLRECARQICPWYRSGATFSSPVTTPRAQSWRPARGVNLPARLHDFGHVPVRGANLFQFVVCLDVIAKLDPAACRVQVVNVFNEKIVVHFTCLSL